MDLPTVTSVLRPATRGALPRLGPGQAWLGGGTWLFSEPQHGLHGLVDLLDLRWPALELDGDCLRVAATCTIGELERAAVDPGWAAAALFGACASALLGSFKIRNVATVGGNICLALPAAPMVALAVALDGVAWVWPREGGERRMPMADFVLGPRTTALQAGDLLRAVELPLAALRRRTALRQASLTSQGRSAALLLATHDPASGRFSLTVTASTRRPVHWVWPAAPPPGTVDDMIAALPDALWFNDAHGAPAWRRHMTRVLAAELLQELCG